MAKSKKPGSPTPPRRLVEETCKAFELLEDNRPAEALVILEELNKTYPNTPNILGGLVNAYFDMGNLSEYEHATRQLSRLEPRNANLSFSLAGAFMTNSRPALALHTFQETLRRWPNNHHAGEACKEIQILEKRLQALAAEVGMPIEQAFELFIQHDELRYCLMHGEYRRGKQVAEKVLRRFPYFVPVLNNLGQIYAVEGEMNKAVQMALRVLELEPENIHALSNLARLHFLGGYPVEADGYKLRLKQSKAVASDRWTKIAEALTFLEDDQGVLALYAQAEAAGELEPPETDEIFYHLLAVAACRLGKEKDARKYWQKSLQINPNFKWAQENLDDLIRPVAKRSGVWAYPIENWLLGQVIQGISRYMQKETRGLKKEDIQKSFSSFVEEKYPKVIFLAPHLVERGDARAREFVVRMAAISGQPALLEAAKAFIFGKIGSFEERFQKSKILAEASLLPSGQARMWSEGEWRDVLMLSIKITPEPTEPKRSKKAQELYKQSCEALYEQDGERAQSILEQVVASYPDDPGLLNNLAVAHQFQGHFDTASQMLKDIHHRFPDYFFGIIGMASLATMNGDTQQAHALLNRLMQQKKMHTSEFSALCKAQIQISFAEDNHEVARTWLEMWEKVDPDNPDQLAYRKEMRSKKVNTKK